MSRHFRLKSELSGAIAKRHPHAKNQFSVPGSFFNQRYILYIKMLGFFVFVFCLSELIEELGSQSCENWHVLGVK